VKKWGIGFLAVVSVWLAARPTAAAQVVIGLSPGIAIPLGGPRTQTFSAGAGAGLRIMGLYKRRASLAFSTGYYYHGRPGDDANIGYVPVMLNLRGYLPVNEAEDLLAFAGFEGGWNIIGTEIGANFTENSDIGVGGEAGLLWIFMPGVAFESRVLFRNLWTRPEEQPIASYQLLNLEAGIVLPF